MAVLNSRSLRMNEITREDLRYRRDSTAESDIQLWK